MNTTGINANLLRAKMAERDLKQYQIAPLLDVSRPTLNRIILGKSSPTLEFIQKTVEVLGLTPEEFIAIYYNREGENK